MADYKKMYNILFNASSDAVTLLGKNDAEAALFALISAQRAAEEIYISAEETPLRLYPKTGDG